MGNEIALRYKSKTPEVPRARGQIDVDRGRIVDIFLDRDKVSEEQVRQAMKIAENDRLRDRAEASEEPLRTVRGVRRDRTRYPGRGRAPLRVGPGRPAVPEGGGPPVRRDGAQG